MNVNETSEAALPKIDDILSAFRVEKLEPARLNFFYKAGLLLVAVMMILLPLVYLGLIGGVAWWSWMVLFAPEREFEARFGIEHDGLVFFSGVMAAIGVFFLVKPLFARRGKAPAPLVLGPEEETALRTFVHRVADAVGAKRPRAIEVDCEVNAAAAFRRGFGSLFTNDLKLVVGLPLAAGLSVSSFGGVLAHEFGHFAQGTGMRLTYLIRSINAWFARVVYERDAWDERLARWSRGGDLRLMLFLMATRLFIWLSRRVLWVLMHIGHGISCFAMRQMEYDADSYEIQFAGSEAFQKTSRQMVLLGIGSGRAHTLLGEAWENRQLARNLPRLGVNQTRTLPETVHAEIDKVEAAARTGLFDTHPSNADRIAAAQRMAAPGVFACDAPASLLFSDFDALAERATRHYYQIALELPVTDEQLVDNAEIEGTDAARQEAMRSLSAYFFGDISIWHPVFVTPADLAHAPDISGAELIHLRDALKSERDARAEAEKSLDELDTQRDNALRARSLLNAGFKIKGPDFGLNRGDLASVSGLEVKINPRRDELIQSLAPLDDLCARRLTAGLKARKNANAPCDEIDRLAATLEGLREVFPILVELRDLLVGQSILLANLSAENAESLINLLRINSGELSQRVNRVRSKIGEITHPFPHSRGSLNLRELISTEHDADIDPVFTRQTDAEKAVNTLFTLYFQALGRLTQLAEDASPTASDQTGSDRR